MDTLAYYSRQTNLPEVGLAGQERLRQGRCLVIGAGGLGSSALYYLASAGIGKIGICDADLVDVSNLHRQILFSADDIGYSKAEKAAEKLRKHNPLIEISAYNEKLSGSNCEQILSGYDLILDCTDNFPAKFLLNDAAHLLKKALIRASIYRFEGQLQCYVPERGDACLRCLWPEMPQEGCVNNCAEAGVLGPLPGFFGVLQAMEAIKYFLKLPLLDAGALLNYDLLSHSQKILHLSKEESCPLCGKHPQITTLLYHQPMEIEAKQFSPGKFQLIDIREEGEVKSDPLLSYPSRHMPMSAFKPQELDMHTPYLLFCHRGRRSLQLVTNLRTNGWKNVYSLVGGIISLQDAETV